MAMSTGRSTRARPLHGAQRDRGDPTGRASGAADVLPAGAPRHAVFLDKDGMLVENVPYNVDPARLQFVEYVYQRIDVVGSGRFLYPVQSRAVVVDVLERLLAAVPSGALPADGSSTPAERRRILSRVRDVLGSTRETS